MIWWLNRTIQRRVGKLLIFIAVLQAGFSVFLFASTKIALQFLKISRQDNTFIDLFSILSFLISVVLLKNLYETWDKSRDIIRLMGIGSFLIGAYLIIIYGWLRFFSLPMIVWGGFNLLVAVVCWMYLKCWQADRWV